jgi:diketogulonate reductase-like aldo/keto reductase
MSLFLDTLSLRSGYSIPAVGLGTYQMKGAACFKAVQAALEVGYRHIDTARFYQNEADIARAMMDVDRSQIFLTSKIATQDHGYDEAYAAGQEYLRLLKVDYLDLLLIHWPGAPGASPTAKANRTVRHETWRAMEKLVEEGKVRSIGVSNFLEKHLRPLLDECVIPPAVNQFEYHPLCQNSSLVSFCKENDIVVEAYSSLARGHLELFDNPRIQAIADLHSVSIAQVLLRWALQQDIVVIPKSKDPDRVRSNAELGHFELSRAEMEYLSSLDQGLHTCWNPSSVY